MIAKTVRCIADDVAERRAPNTLQYIPGFRRPGRANLGHDQRHVLGDLHLDQCRFRSQRAPLGVGSPVRRDFVTMAPKFTPDEEAEIELMLWEYDRDGRIAIENFFRREPELSLRMTGGIIPKRIQRDLMAYLKALRPR